MSDLETTYYQALQDSAGSRLVHGRRWLKARFAIIGAACLVLLSIAGISIRNKERWLARVISVADVTKSSVHSHAMDVLVKRIFDTHASVDKDLDHWARKAYLENATFGMPRRLAMSARTGLRSRYSFTHPHLSSGDRSRRMEMPGRNKQMPVVRNDLRSLQHVRSAPSATSLTEHIMTNLPAMEQSGGAGGQSTYEGLLRIDAGWNALKNGKLPKVRHIVHEELNAPAELPEYDVVICGGNIGVLVAAALQVRGLRVAVVEAGPLRGREQDWNVARNEIEELTKLGVITQAELESIIGIEFNPMRVGFPGGEDVWVQNVLNIGVRPKELISAARGTFESKGGVVFETAPLTAVAVRPGAAVISLGGAKWTNTTLKTRLLIDCMGGRSPIVSQIREDQLPDSVAVVVGSSARGFDEKSNIYGDLFYTDQLTRPVGDAGCPTQYFWEAFPASSGPRDRTTYLFTYMDLDPARPSILNIMEDYWKLMPSYQGVELDDLEVQRVLYGFFTSYKKSPLPSGFDRVLQVGDASGIQSPLSFGGFAALTRHLGRLTAAISGALEADALTKGELSLINPYQPNLRATWLFQETMRPPIGNAIGSGSDANSMSRADDFISKVLVLTFVVMQKEGDVVMRPFLQDVLRVDGLVKTIGGLMVRDPLFQAQMVVTLGAPTLLDWNFHFIAMCIYSALHTTAAPLLKKFEERLPPRIAYRVARCVEGWKYGSGLDYVAAKSTPLSLEMAERVKAVVQATRARAVQSKLEGQWSNATVR